MSAKRETSSKAETEPEDVAVVHIFCDGACSGNPGPGGYGAILRFNGHEKEIKGGEANTTNNRMELTAAIEALRQLKRPCKVVITTDSQYLVKGMTEWIAGWQRKGWLNSKREPVVNRDLWEELLELSRKHTITWKWVRGHDGHVENERCDCLAREAIGGCIK
jgi:ribonuclease HI